MFDAKLRQFNDGLNNTEIQTKNKNISLDELTTLFIAHCLKLKKNIKKIAFIGNGGSASIASHMATDFSKNAHIRSICFNDGSYLTCLSNDYSYEEAFSKAIEMHLDSEDILIAISSSGNSPNICQAVLQAKKQNVFTITLSGFTPKNKLRTLGDINIYLPNMEYGIVENGHQFIIHHFLDELCKIK